MRRKFLIFLLIIACGFFIWEKSGIGIEYRTNKAVKIYNSGRYEDAVSSFEHILLFSPENSTARYYYVLSLSKVEPIYSVQEKMYKISESKIDDKARQLARAQIVSMKHKLLEGVEDNYIYNAISGKDIIHWNINTFPLKIYTETAGDIPSYYMESINKAFNQWSARTNFVRFTQANNESDANIILRFKDYSSSDCTSAGCHYTIAYTEPELGANSVLKKMVLTFYKTNPRKAYFSPLEVYNSALHEIGHTLGIMGHSDNSSDVMYSNNDKTKDIFAMYRSDYQYLTSNDIRTLALLYRLKPTITDVKSDSENFYYPPLILGSGDEVLNKKLREWENYIKKYPNLSSGYMNAASVYADMGNYDNALNYLTLAEKIDNSAETTYTCEYNRAVIYYNQQKYDQALIHAQKAKALKNDATINELIEEIKKLSKL